MYQFIPTKEYHYIYEGNLNIAILYGMRMVFNSLVVYDIHSARFVVCNYWSLDDGLFLKSNFWLSKAKVGNQKLRKLLKLTLTQISELPCTFSPLMRRYFCHTQVKPDIMSFEFFFSHQSAMSGHLGLIILSIYCSVVSLNKNRGNFFFLVGR